MRLFRSKYFSFSAIFFFGWAAFATFALDFVFYSEQVGFTSAEIGLIYAVKVLIAILFQPIFGIICDYIRSTKKMLIVMGIAAIFLSAGIPLVTSKVSILILDFTYTIAVCAFMALLDNWAAGECVNEEKFHFGSLRLWGSISFAITAYIYGLLTMRMAVGNMYFGRAIFFAITVIFVFLNQYDKRAVPEPKEKKEKPDIKALFSMKEYWLFFVFLFIFCFPINAVNAFFPKLMLDRGSTNYTIALFAAIHAIAEVPFFLYIRKLTKKIGSRGLILIGAVFVIIRMVGFAFAGSVPMLLAAYLCQIPYVTFFGPGLIYYSRSIAPKNTQAFTLTSLQGLAIGISGMLGTYVFGMVADSRGIQSLFAYSAVICITGFALFIVTSFLLKKNRHNS